MEFKTFPMYKDLLCLRLDKTVQSLFFIIVPFKVHDTMNGRQKDSTRLTIGLNYWNFCAPHFGLLSATDQSITYS